MSNELYLYGKHPAPQVEFSNERFEIGDLVSTILGEHGVIVAYGPHTDHHNFSKHDKTNYYQVLIEGNVRHYISASLRKYKK